MRKILIVFIRVYQYAISPYFSSSCRYSPTCSAYAIDSIKSFGAVKGSWLALKRVSRCHPWHEGGVDPVPESPLPENMSPETTSNKAISRTAIK